MKCKEFIVHQARNGEGVECFHEQLVSLLIVFVETLGSEVEKLGHLSALVIAPQHVNGGGEVQFQGVKQQNHFA